MENILDSIKKLLGIDEADLNFDQELIMHINSVFMVLNQLGVGPVGGFKISSKILLRLRAPVFLSLALLAIAFNAKSETFNSTPSSCNNLLYCFINAFLGSVKILIKK